MATKTKKGANDPEKTETRGVKSYALTEEQMVTTSIYYPLFCCEPETEHRATTEVLAAVDDYMTDIEADWEPGDARHFYTFSQLEIRPRVDLSPEALWDRRVLFSRMIDDLFDPETAWGCLCEIEAAFVRLAEEDRHQWKTRMQAFWQEVERIEAPFRAIGGAA